MVLFLLVLMILKLNEDELQGEKIDGGVAGIIVSRGNLIRVLMCLELLLTDSTGKK